MAPRAEKCLEAGSSQRDSRLRWQQMLRKSGKISDKSQSFQSKSPPIISLLLGTRQHTEGINSLIVAYSQMGISIFYLFNLLLGSSCYRQGKLRRTMAKWLVQMLPVAEQKIERKLLESSYTPLLLLCWFNRGATVCYLHVPDFSGCNNTRVQSVACISLIFLSVKWGYLYYRWKCW